MINLMGYVVFFLTKRDGWPGHAPDRLRLPPLGSAAGDAHMVGRHYKHLREVSNE
jgi:hypothetical protein